MAKHFKKEGSYTEADAAALMRMMLSAVQSCHTKGVVHRDIKVLPSEPGATLLETLQMVHTLIL